MKSLLTGFLGLFAAAGPALAQVESVTPSTEPAAQDEGGKVVWLLLKGGSGDSPAFFAIPTGSQEQCEISGAEYLVSERLNHNPRFRGMECLEGIR